MENAGRGVADVVERLLTRPDPIVILCGTGNNGGDGFVAARHLHNAGHDVRLGALGPARPGSDAAVNRAICERMGLDVLSCMEALASTSPSTIPVPVPSHVAPTSPGPAVIVDALLGTGADRAPEGELLDVIEAINLAAQRGAVVVAVDIPSGLDADTGRVLGSTAVHATVTATLAALKPGLLGPPGSDFCGAVECLEIGLPRALVDEMAEGVRGARRAEGSGHDPE